MMILVALHDIMVQLSNAINHLSDEEYGHPSNLLSGASIGQHSGHIIGFFQVLDQGYGNGIVNYDLYTRDTVIENNRETARQLIQQYTTKCQKPDKALVVEIITTGNCELEYLGSSYYRELGYLLEHSIHHMAFIRIAMMEISTAKLPEEFGFAPVTTLHKKSRFLLPDNS